MSLLLEPLINQTIHVIATDGRSFKGLLAGFDQMANVVLKDTEERVLSPSGISVIPLGLYIIRGDTVAVVGELDQDVENNINLSRLSSQPIPPFRGGGY